MRSPDRPTLAALRARAHKGRHREIGNWLARRWARPTAVYGTWLAVRLGLSAHQVTLLAVGTSLLSALCFALGTREGFVVGAILGFLAFWLDRVDGQVARWRGTASLDGVYFDYLMHHAAGLWLGFGLGYGLTRADGDPRWTIAGFAAAFGWTFLNLQNDCRYKAFFQRLKRETARYRVDGGSGGRPEPPTPWRLRGRSAWTWPAYKACEPHVVLIGLGLLAVAAVASPPAWAIGLRVGLLGMAVLAPLLALGRCARAVSRGAVEAEFAAWFRPEDDA